MSGTVKETKRTTQEKENKITWELIEAMRKSAKIEREDLKMGPRLTKWETMEGEEEHGDIEETHNALSIMEEDWQLNLQEKAIVLRSPGINTIRIISTTEERETTIRYITPWNVWSLAKVKQRKKQAENWQPSFLYPKATRK